MANANLTVDEVRVVGCLMEKAVTTPDQCPLTLNALTLACNQKSSREPVLSLDQDTVRRTARTLEDKGLVTRDENFRTGVTKYSQRLCNTPFSDFQFTAAEYAIVSVLLSARGADAGRTADPLCAIARVQGQRSGGRNLRRAPGPGARGRCRGGKAPPRAGTPRPRIHASVRRRDRLGAGRGTACSPARATVAARRVGGKGRGARTRSLRAQGTPNFVGAALVGRPPCRIDDAARLSLAAQVRHTDPMNKLDLFIDGQFVPRPRRRHRGHESRHPGSPVRGAVRYR